MVTPLTTPSKMAAAGGSPPAVPGQKDGLIRLLLQNAGTGSASSPQASVSLT